MFVYRAPWGAKNTIMVPMFYVYPIELVTNFSQKKVSWLTQWRSHIYQSMMANTIQGTWYHADAYSYPSCKAYKNTNVINVRISILYQDRMKRRRRENTTNLRTWSKVFWTFHLAQSVWDQVMFAHRRVRPHRPTRREPLPYSEINMLHKLHL